MQGGLEWGDWDHPLWCVHNKNDEGIYTEWQPGVCVSEAEQNEEDIPGRVQSGRRN